MAQGAGEIQSAEVVHAQVVLEQSGLVERDAAVLLRGCGVTLEEAGVLLVKTTFASLDEGIEFRRAVDS